MVARKVMGRLDVPYQQKAAERIENMVLLPDGGVSRRRGQILIHDGLGISEHAEGLYGAQSIPAFAVVRRGEASGEQSWMIWIDSTGPTLEALNLATGATQSVSAANLVAGDAIETTDTFYSLPDADVANQHVQFWTPTTAWRLNLHTWTLTELSGDELGTIFQNRLIVADKTWGTVKMSIPLDLLDFTMTTSVAIPDTDPVQYETIDSGAVEMIPDFYGAERVRWIDSRQSLYLGTDRAEYEIISAQPYFSNDIGGAQIARISTIGTEGTAYLGPYMVFRRGERLIRTEWSQGDRYLTESMAEFIDNGSWIRHLSVEYGSHRYLLALDIEGDLYCYTEAPFSQVAGWALLASGIGWIETYENDLFVAQADGAGAFNARIIPLDSLFNPGDRSAFRTEAFRRAPLYGDAAGYLELTVGAVQGDRLPASSTVSVYKLAGGSAEFVADYSTNASGELDDTLSNIKTATGWTSGTMALACVSSSTQASRLVTLPLHIPNALGPSLGALKSVGKIVVVVVDSTAFRARVNGGEWANWTEDQAFTGTVTVNPRSSSSETIQVEIESVGANALTVMSVLVDVEVSDL